MIDELPDNSIGSTDIDTLVSATRTCRRFKQDRQIPTSLLHSLINLARLSGSARNCQTWQYMVVNAPEICERMFPFLTWAGYLKDWKGPEPGEQPSAYILCFLHQERLIVREKEAYFDLGIASQNILLGAAAQNILGCRIAAFSRKIEDIFDIPEHLKLELVIALGEPQEEIIIEDVHENHIAYWHDANGVHHVPKRPLQDVLIDVPLSSE